MRQRRIYLKLIALGLLSGGVFGVSTVACCYEQNLSRSASVALPFQAGALSTGLRVDTYGDSLRLEFTEPVLLTSLGGIQVERCSSRSDPFLIASPVGEPDVENNPPFVTSMGGVDGFISDPDLMAGASSWSSWGGLGGRGGAVAFDDSMGGATQPVSVGGSPPWSADPSPTTPSSPPVSQEFSKYSTCYAFAVSDGSIGLRVTRRSDTRDQVMRVTGTITATARACGRWRPDVIAIILQPES